MVTLKDLRREVDEVDEHILHLLANRIRICESIGLEKKTQGLPVKDTAREEAVFERVKKLAAKSGLNPIEVEAVYREIVNMCSSVQK